MRDSDQRQSARPVTPRSTPVLHTIIGAMIVVATAGWALLGNPDAPEAAGYAGRVLVGAAGWAVGAAIVRRRQGLLPGLAVAVAVGVAMLAGLPASLDGTAAAPPLGYANANAALCAAAVAGLLIASATSGPHARPCLIAALGFVAMAALTGSRAGAASAVLLVAVWPFLTRHGSSAAWRLLGTALLLLGLATVCGLAAFAGRIGDSPLVERTLSGVRVSLWSDALSMASEHPLTGVGAGNFGRLSATAAGDPDLAWAHSLPLQVVAEQGLVGFVLLCTLVAWMVGRLGRASMVLALLALPTLVDHVMDYGAVMSAYAVVLGAATSLRRRSGSIHGPRGAHDRVSRPPG